MAAKATPDGYTLLLISVAHAFNPAMYKKLPYDPEKSFAPIGLVAAGPVALMVHPSRAGDVGEGADRARQGEARRAQLRDRRRRQLPAPRERAVQAADRRQHRAHPVQGRRAGDVDTIAGQAQINMASMIQVIPHAKSGKLQAARDERRDAQRLFPGRADGGRDRSRLRRHQLVGHWSRPRERRPRR